MGPVEQLTSTSPVHGELQPQVLPTITLGQDHPQHTANCCHLVVIFHVAFQRI